jgi:DNA-binding NarL/FixJ family response regulator
MTGEQAVEEFTRLLDPWTDPELEYLRARTFFAYAHKLKELGYDADSEEMKSIAHTILSEIGIDTSWSTRESEDEPSPSILDSLNDKEVPVVELVAQGFKNHVIAHELFVSVRTVELRLTNIFRKVGVKSRYELMRLLEREGSDFLRGL